MNRWKVVGVVVLIVFGVWFLRYITTPLPGTKIEDMGREHVSFAEVEKTAYNSNPPTSGPHVTTWVKPGIYDKPQSEGELIHSLEHGYVIISYNCGVHLNDNSKFQNPKSKQISKSKIQLTVSAHEEDESTGSAGERPTEATESAGAVNDTEACKNLIKQMEELARKKKLFKLIVVPRPNLDTTVALTAWNYIDKFDPPAGGLDTKRIERFIDYHRDHGPEKTME